MRVSYVSDYRSLAYHSQSLVLVYKETYCINHHYRL